MCLLALKGFVIVYLVVYLVGHCNYCGPQNLSVTINAVQENKVVFLILISLSCWILWKVRL